MSRPELNLRSDRAGYFDDAASWASDIEQSRRRTHRLGWWAAGAASAVALLEAVALVALAPLKTTVPYVITVDRQSGEVALAQRLLPGGTLTQREAVIQAALVQYVLARETFDATDLAEQYRRVQLWSADPARTDYLRGMARSNPASPLNLYSAGTTVTTEVKGVSLIGPGSAIVRFDTERSGGGAPVRASYTAAIGFRFTGEPLRMSDRVVNPLGFQVLRYRRDADMIEQPATAPAPISAPARPSRIFAR